MLLAAVGAIVSTPMIWLLDGPEAGQLVGAVVQGATGVGALVWAWLQPNAPVSRDAAARTGRAEAHSGGRAHTGIRRRGGGSTGAARVEQTGDAIARGPGSTAGTGIDYTG